jgi:precorrin-6Y C5,15-methyltransferase (decarboxylating)
MNDDVDYGPNRVGDSTADRSVLDGETAPTAAVVQVIGIDPSLPSQVNLHGDVARSLPDADLIVGAARHLACVGVLSGGEQVVLGPLDPAVERLRTAVAAGRRCVVLASGDPSFFGIVRRLTEEGFSLQVTPSVSSIATAFARAGLSWDGAAVVSAHGRDLGPALNACRALPTVAVLTAPGAGAAELGAGLAGWNRKLVVAERLGTPDECVTDVTPSQAVGRTWKDPHVVLVLDPSARTAHAGQSPRWDNQPAAGPSGGWGLPERAYQHRNSMITKSEVRSVAVAALRPRLGRLVWDLGAGSGSVGIECGLLGAAVIAVEQDHDACALIRANATAHGVDVRVVAGTAPAALAGLPDPDAVFVGGGGIEVVEGVARRRPADGPRRVVVALAALDRVAPAMQALRGNGFTVDGVQLSAARLADLPGGSVRLAATNPVFVLTGDRS